MKSFALHLVVVFILGTEFQRLATFCSSSPTAQAASSPSSLPLASSIASSPLPFGQRRRFIAGVKGPLDSSTSLPEAATAVEPHPTNHTTKQSAVKTSRTIQRLIAGHIQHSSGSSPNRVNETKNNTSRITKIYFRRRQNPEFQRVHRSEPKTTILRKIIPTQVGPAFEDDDDDDDYQDEAFLEDSNDINNNWDDGILRLNAGAGKDASSTKSKKNEDSKKTLSDQVKDGKYGLIENELFRKPPKRPGIISYLPNKEVPNDTKDNYGGLKEEDIWLAEDHLLVLKGGGLNTESDSEPWHPIDDYQASNRQIKIPPNPKVPPPFPVQLEAGGPIQFIGNHKFPFFYPDANGSLSIFPENGYGPAETNGNNEKNLFAGSRSSQNATVNQSGQYSYPQPYAPWLFNNESFKNPFLNFGPPQPGPFPFDNGNDYVDEDDPSLYYPPPYSFVYESNYSNPVKPGPLVPGIVLPPPPNAFAPLDDRQSTQRKPVKTLSFNEILNKITEEKPEVLENVLTTTTEIPAITTTTTIITTSDLPPPSTKSKEVYYIRQKTRPYSPAQTTTQQLPLSPTTTSTTPPPEVISFVPQISTTIDPLSTGKPIYFEYFDARKIAPTQSSFTEIPQSPPRPVRPVQPVQPASPVKFYKPQKIFSTPVYKELPDSNKLPQQQIQQPLRINKVNQPAKPYNYNEYLYITPKPEIYPNGISNNFVVPPAARKPFKIQTTFDDEVYAIRQTLQHFKNLQIHNNYIPRAPKTKPVYEYTFAATAPTPGDAYPNQAFTPPTSFDPEPFKPMLQYSQPVDNVNGFKAMAYPRTDILRQTERNDYYTTLAPPASLKLQIQVSDRRPESSTLRSIDYAARDQRTFIGKPDQYNTPTTILAKKPWVSIEKQIVQEVLPTNGPYATSPPNQNDINRNIGADFSRNIPRNPNQPARFQGYYYTQPLSQRTNHRFQQYPADQQPFSKQVSSIRAQLSQYQSAPLLSSLENDTFINNLPGRAVEPDAEYINLPPPPPRRELYQQHRLSPLAKQRLPPQGGGGGGPYRQPVDLESDILVNYRLPLPPVNPDSEFIQPPPLPSQYLNRNPQSYYQRPLPQYSVVEPRRPPNNQPRPPNVYYVRSERDARNKET